MTAWRLALAVPGLAALAYAATLPWNVPDDDAWRSVLTWLAGGVIVHDGLLAPIVIAVGVVGARWLPAPWRAPAVVGLVSWGSLTLLAIPVLSGNGVDPTNETLQHRPYITSWWIGSVAVVALIAVAGWWRRHSAMRGRPLSRGGRTR
jgi:hypothetical protein